MTHGHHLRPACLEVTWRASSYSGGQGNCVEIAEGIPTHIPVRDSKRTAGPVITFSRDAWRAFITYVG